MGCHELPSTGVAFPLADELGTAEGVIWLKSSESEAACVVGEFGSIEVVVSSITIGSVVVVVGKSLAVDMMGDEEQ